MASLLDEDFLNRPIEDLKEFIYSDEGKGEPVEENLEDTLTEPAVRESPFVEQTEEVAAEPVPPSIPEPVMEEQTEEVAAEPVPPSIPEPVMEEQTEEVAAEPVPPSIPEPVMEEQTEEVAAEPVPPSIPEPVMEEQTEEVASESVPPVVPVPPMPRQPEQPEQPVEAEQQPDSQEHETVWIVEKVKKEIDFLNQLEAWVSARCVSLGGIEMFSYKYYGFLADVSHVLAEDIKQMLSDDQAVQALQSEGNESLKQIQDRQISLEAFVQEVKEKLGTDPIPLLKEEITAMEMRKALGAVDESTESEYVGPAPDGFEMLEDPFENKKEKEEDEEKESQEVVAQMNKMEQEATDLPVVETLEPASQIDTAQPPEMPVAEEINKTDSESEPVSAPENKPQSSLTKKGILGQMEVESDSTTQTEE